MIFKHLIERDPTIKELEGKVYEKLFGLRGNDPIKPSKHSVTEISFEDAIKELINLQKKV